MGDKHFLGLDDNKVLIYADIIGFSNMIKECEDLGWDIQHTSGIIVNLPAVYKIITQYDFSEQYQQENNFKFLWVSDSIILSSDKNQISLLLDILSNLINQLYCAGFAVRGAICSGKLYHKENIWGTPLVEASRLEKNEAIYPRIILSTTEFEQLNISDLYKPYFKKTEKEQFVYFDYFDSFFSAQINEGKDILCYLGVYSTFILNNFKKCYEDHHKKKWLWLADELRKQISKNKSYIQDLMSLKEVYNCTSHKRMTDYTEYLDILDSVK